LLLRARITGGRVLGQLQPRDQRIVRERAVELEVGVADAIEQLAVDARGRAYEAFLDDRVFAEDQVEARAFTLLRRERQWREQEGSRDNSAGRHRSSRSRVRYRIPAGAPFSCS